MKEIFLICGAVVALFGTIVLLIGGSYIVFTMIKDDLQARKEAAEEYERERAKAEYLRERNEEKY